MLEQVLNQVLSDAISTKTAHCAGMLASVQLKALELSVLEQEMQELQEKVGPRRARA